MRTIEVDFDVFKALTMRRASEGVTENDVLRKILGLPNRKSLPAESPGPGPGDWITKGIRFPAGSELRATYKGQTHLARIESSALVLGGRRYDSPSAAAMSITGTPVNGWTFWEYRFPGQSGWKILKSLRKSGG